MPGLGQEVLALSRGADLVVVLPEPGDGGPAGVEDVRSAVRGRTAALGPAVAPRDAWVSLVCVRVALNHHRDTGAADGRLLIVGDRLADVHLLGGAHIGRLLADRALGALDGLPAGRAARLAETLDALLMSWGRSAPEVAQALGIHPQTARKRLRQLDALFDGRLADPDFRFAALLALRTRALGR
ncbi:helix-turn-helix domain-containing protein [Streptomyces rimosus]